MFTNLLEYLAANKTIIVGATATVSEVVVIIVNSWRKIQAEKRRVGTLGAIPTSRLRLFLWAANPINLFRQP